jgi:hypothetical protein
MPLAPNRHYCGPFIDIIPLTVVLFFAIAGRVGPDPLLTDATMVTALFAVIALMFTAILTPEPVGLGCPRWMGIVVAACLAEVCGIAAVDLIWKVTRPEWSLLYVSATLTCLNLAGVIILNLAVAENVPTGLIVGGAASSLILWMGGTLSFGPAQIIAVTLLVLHASLRLLFALRPRDG